LRVCGLGLSWVWRVRKTLNPDRFRAQGFTVQRFRVQGFTFHGFRVQGFTSIGVDSVLEASELARIHELFFKTDEGVEGSQIPDANYPDFCELACYLMFASHDDWMPAE